MNCVNKQPNRSVDEALRLRAYEFLRSASLVIEPRRQWPSGASQLLSGRISEALRACPGRVLSVYGDAGWGREVARCKYQVGEFSEPLITASAELIEARWKPDPSPAWVTAVPSLRDPRLVYTFARRLAERLGLPFVPVLRKASERPAQKTMANSAQQLRNLIDAFEIAAPLPAGPVLLIDDVVDSRWTITVVAWLLQKVDGRSPVCPGQRLGRRNLMNSDSQAVVLLCSMIGRRTTNLFAHSDRELSDLERRSRLGDRGTRRVAWSVGRRCGSRIGSRGE
jgi:ATP-dependent DNA helicase RecQ